MKSWRISYQKELIFSQLYVLSFYAQKYYFMATIKEKAQKRLFFGEATHEESQKTLIRMISQLTTLQMSSIPIDVTLAKFFDLIWKNKLKIFMGWLVLAILLNLVSLNNGNLSFYQNIMLLLQLGSIILSPFL